MFFVDCGSYVQDDDLTTQLKSAPAPPANHLKMASTFAAVVGRPTWQQTMLRIKDPKKSIPFYTDIMGMTIIDTLDFPQWNFKLWFLTTLPEGETYSLTPGTKEAHDYMWSIEGTALELMWNYGTEDRKRMGLGILHLIRMMCMQLA